MKDPTKRISRDRFNFEQLFREAGRSASYQSRVRRILEGPHPPEDVILNLAMGTLLLHEKAEWEDHIAQCPQCTRHFLDACRERSDRRGIERECQLAWKDVIRNLVASKDFWVMSIAERATLVTKNAPKLKFATDVDWLLPVPYRLLTSQPIETDQLFAHERASLKVQSVEDGYVAAFLCNESEFVTLLYPDHRDDDSGIRADEIKEIRFEAPDKPGRYRINVVWTKDELLDPNDIDFSDLEFDPALQGFSKWFCWNELKEDEWALANLSFTVNNAPKERGEKVELPDDAKLVAVRAVDLKSSDSTHWVPFLFNQLRSGVACFGWACSDLRNLRSNTMRSAEEEECWRHAKFLLDLKEGDLLIYVNVPERTECTIVRVLSPYMYTSLWDPEPLGTSLHVVLCEFIGVFDRDCVAVHPDLSRRLKLRGAHWELKGMKDHVAILLSHFQ